ncbi:phosphoribosylanthranilate isomerase [Chryseolinea sp. T2]|uniref:phosphoribosylanthranilate isomerase n=1 Tax=Chryseolinea sp. T2 TaxID=3129255 RepID=UPI0030782182
MKRAQGNRSKLVEKTIRIKICGMREAANIVTVASMRPDYLGFIEYPLSPRFVGYKFRMPALPSAIERVGVFVSETLENVRNRIKVVGYDAVQLHGDESPDFASKMRDDGVKVIKVFRVDDNFDFNETKPFVGRVDQLLFDARGKQPGGNGIRFNPMILRRYDQEVPFFLSGGLQPETLKENIAELSEMNLYGVDLNSGVETAPGLKDAFRVQTSINHINDLRKNR